MGLEIQNHTIYVGENYSFTFSGNIGYNYAMGIRSYYLTYGSDTDHEIHNLEIRLSAQINGNVITVTPQIIMDDSSGHEVSSGDSYVNVMVIASIGDSDQSYFTIGNAMNIPDGGSGNSIMYNSNQVINTNAFLSGFQLEYDGDHQIKDIHVGAGVTSDPSNQSFQINATAIMDDNSGNEAETASVDSGYLVCYTDDIQIGHLTVSKSSESTYVFSNPIGEVHAVLTDNNMSFGNSDNEIKIISSRIDSISIASSDQKTVTVKGNLFMEDNSDNISTTASASYLLIGM